MTHVGRGPAAPEVALFAAGTTPLAVATLPIMAGETQLATVLLADVRTRPDLAEARRSAALDDLRALVEGVLQPPAGEPITASHPIAPTPRPPIDLRHHSGSQRRRVGSSQRAPRPDPVTGLPDRAFVHLETERRIERAAVMGQGLALAIVSLDRFRRVNDSLGHALGDVLLRQVAQRLLSSIDDGDLAGRRSGDEFIVLLDDVRAGVSALQRSDRIQQAIREPFHLDAHEIVLTAGIGVARYPDDAPDAATLLRYADIALHQAKNEGPGRLKLFDASMQQTARERLDLEHQLREAMRSGQLSLHYQPKYSIATRQLVGAEALLRWKHPQRGMISPGRFIPVAEDSGLIVPIGTWALNEVARQCKRWSDAGLEYGRVSVNVSGLQFVRHDFVGTVKRAVRAASIPPERLELELTETIVMGEVEQAIVRLSALRSLGVRVSVDDFGTGYSSLAYLQKLPVDVLKIDRSFVQELDREGLPAEQARSLAQAITFLGHQLGLDVLAEGVETPTQLEQLANVGCDEVQGYLFGKPMPPDAFERHVRES
ncbi:diguanylate cyclase/phosphodiesterase (GGDEF & EAL domains) with PAS/PAC sensor(s) [Sandaracinus amylolyticus]|uniref:Diguanylate cyclase/phosphodiesterase (GGDEF & EAL domains) with PAS/PAC sensor(S) n=1 Tax=Sandaracinus amylolyticus TaxID=927083 RepID=A0A0F6SI43_9BACT|nr:diguanylate cyclase/phosphodiesterase (GGDEF & EAL domains) with PAS/PAC sensor(s) [Sandaracinus amylolyticus]